MASDVSALLSMAGYLVAMYSLPIIAWVVSIPMMAASIVEWSYRRLA